MLNLKNVLDQLNPNYEFTLYDSQNFNVLYSKLYNLSKYSTSNLPTLNNTIFQKWENKDIELFYKKFP